MKKLIKQSLFVCACILFIVSCAKNGPDGYTKSENGLYYKFIGERALENPQPKMGDLLVGEATIRLEDSVLMSNVGNPQRLFFVTEDQFVGDINSGFLMMHTGEEASFAVPADTVAKFMPMPDFYVENSGLYIYYDFKLESIISKETIDQEREEALLRIEEMKNKEQDYINGYLTANNIKVKPTASGLYIVSLKKGNGAKVEAGKTLKTNYKGSFVDGRIFDTNIEEDAKASGNYNPQRPYEPMEYVHGQMSLIAGWDEAVSGMRAGDKVRVVMPSHMAYGEHGSNPVIPPYAPLVFEIEVLSVE